MSEKDEISFTGSEAFLFLKALGLKISKAKIYVDIRNGKFPCRSDKRVCESDLLVYAENLRAPQTGGSDNAQERKVRTFLADMVRELLSLAAPSPAMNVKLEHWSQEVTTLPQGKTLDTVCRALEKARQNKPAPVTRISNTQKTEFLLQGIALGIAAKGNVYRKDSLFLARWIRNHPSVKTIPPIAALLREAERTNLAHTEDCNNSTSCLQQKLNEFIVSNGFKVSNIKIKGEKWRGANNPSVIISKYDAMFDHVEKIDFSATFCFTGLFAFGSREQCEKSVMQLGACVKQYPLKTEKNYLIVGTASNPQWRSIKSGSKIDNAICFKQTGGNIKIVYEDEWVELLLKEQRIRGIIPPAPVPSGQFRPPWPLHTLCFLIPPQNFDKIKHVLCAENVQIKDNCHSNVDAIILPSRLCDASEDELANLPEVGEVKAAEVTSARDSGILIISEEEFRTWVWWEKDGVMFLPPTT